MTLPSDGKKLSEQEAQSIEIAIEESGLTAKFILRGWKRWQTDWYRNSKYNQKVKQPMKRGGVLVILWMIDI